MYIIGGVSGLGADLCRLLPAIINRSAWRRHRSGAPLAFA